MILVCAMICAGQLYGMEVPKPESWNILPTDIKGVIVTLSKNYTNIDDTIKTLKILSETNKEINNALNIHNKEGFWALVRLLAKNYPDISTENANRELKQDYRYDGLKPETMVMLTIAQKLKSNIFNIIGLDPLPDDSNTSFEALIAAANNLPEDIFNDIHGSGGDGGKQALFKNQRKSYDIYKDF